MSHAGVARAVAVADSVGAPLSNTARSYLYHEPTMNVTVPGWVADRVICCGRQWNVPAETASIWLLAEVWQNCWLPHHPPTPGGTAM